jgi:peptidase E
MAKLYLLGGENLLRRDAKEINSRAFQDAGGTPTVVVFSWAHAAFGRTYMYRKRIFDYFRSLGASNVEFAEFSDAPEVMAQKVSESDVVYITGGFASALITRLRARNVNTLLSRYEGIIVGRSAGALALCKRGVVTDRNKRAAKLVTGLGQADLCLKAHYKPSADKALRHLSMEEKIFAVPGQTAIIYENGAISSTGETFLFDKGEKFPIKSQQTN